MESVIKMEVDESVKEADSGDVIEISYEEKLKYTNPIAKPMASKKLTKKIYKCIKKGKLFKSWNLYKILM